MDRRALLLEHAAAYDLTKEKIKLKLAHTLRVAAYAREIAESLQLAKEEIELAECIAYLHDIGRFEQAKRYDTFLDAQSVDHALLGIELLQENSNALLRRFVQDSAWDEQILCAIRNHNRYAVGDVQDEKQRLHCQIIRDADKIDIFYIGTKESTRVLYLCEEETLCQDTLSAAVYDAFMNERAILHKERRTHLDILVSHLAMLYDLNFPFSASIIKQQDWISKIISRHHFLHKETLFQMKQLQQKAEEVLHRKEKKEDTSVQRNR